MKKASLKRVGGVLKVDIDGEIFEPLSFKSFRPSARNISDFSKAGVKLFSIFPGGITSALGVPYSLFGDSWVGDHKYDFDPVDRQIELFLENAPDCYFALMIQLDTRDWYLEENPDIPHSFRYLSQALCSEKWKKDAADYLKAIISHVEEKYGDRFYGYFMLCGFTTEWFSHFDKEASHPEKERAYQEYLKNPKAKIPSQEILEGVEGEAFLSPEHKEEIKTFRKFHAETISDSILYFAKEAQSVIKHKKLLGVYFGYLLELDGERLWNDGHITYEKVFTSPDIDMISSPSSYCYRSEESTSAFMVTFDTLDQNDKLYYLEFDHITHLSPEKVGDILIPGGKNKCKNETETLNLMQRDFMLCASKGAALWWFDMFEGWFYSESMMNSIEEMIRLQSFLSKNENKSVAEILVVASGKDFYGVNKKSGLNTLCLGKMRNGLMRMGAPYDLYSPCSLNSVDLDSYKLIIFLTPFSLTKKEKDFIAKAKKKHKTILWIYAPDFEQNGEEGIFKTADMRVKALSENEENYIFENTAFSLNDLPNPRFYIDDDALPLALYEGSKKIAIGMKKTPDYTSVYSAVANLDGSILRHVAKEAGVHIYCEDSETPQYTNSFIKCVYNLKDTTLFVEDGKYVDLFSKKEYTAKDGKLFVPKGEFASKMFIKKE
ncbi:MAG: hypothetical protein IKU24_02735, partial [Clostridia bacterium]|nr:hypothetical protein [Clostridia bacterium]